MWLTPYSRRVSPSVNSLVNEFFKGFETVDRPLTESFSPNLDIQEEEKAYHLTVEVPGIDKKDIEISLKDNILAIKGEKKQETKKNEGGYSWKERSYGSFQRSIRLPEAAQEGAVAANLENGVLVITLPKIEQPESKQISIN